MRSSILTFWGSPSIISTEPMQKQIKGSERWGFRSSQTECSERADLRTQSIACVKDDNRLQDYHQNYN